jgi:hypothetical protein
MPLKSPLHGLIYSIEGRFFCRHKRIELPYAYPFESAGINYKLEVKI